MEDNEVFRIKKFMDIIKFICVVMLILIHAHMALVTNQYSFFDTSALSYEMTSRFMFIGLFITILPALAGYVFGLQKKIDIKKTITLFLLFLCVGFFMNVITWGWAYIFSWNVLQFVGLSFLVIAILMKFLTEYEVFLLSVITIMAAAFLSNILAPYNPNNWVAIFVGGRNEFVLWPFFPWFGVVGSGFLYAKYRVKYGGRKWFNAISLVGGLFFMAVAILRGEISARIDPDYVWGPSILTPTLGWILATLGLFLILVVLGSLFSEKIKLRKYGIINSYSKGIMWIYVAQMFVSFRMAIFAKKFFETDNPSIGYFLFMIVMLVIGWLVGVISIKLFQEKKMVIFLKKYNGE